MDGDSSCTSGFTKQGYLVIIMQMIMIMIIIIYYSDYDDHGKYFDENFYYEPFLNLILKERDSFRPFCSECLEIKVKVSSKIIICAKLFKW